MQCTTTLFGRVIEPPAGTESTASLVRDHAAQALLVPHHRRVADLRVEGMAPVPHVVMVVSPPLQGVARTVATATKAQSRLQPGPARR